MSFYFKKPIKIEAHQITVDNLLSLCEWSNHKAEITAKPDKTPTGMMVWTLEGQMTGAIGDYLIKGVRGEFYFCRGDIFEETYEEYK